MFLTHDYSINTAMVSLGQRIDRGDGELYLLNPISVGDDSFIGARASILGGDYWKELHNWSLCCGKRKYS